MLILALEILAKITDFINDKLLDAVNEIDYILIGAAGLLVLIFALQLIFSLFCYSAKFRRKSKLAVENLKALNSIEKLDEDMLAFPKEVGNQWTRFKASPNARFSDFINQSTCVDAPMNIRGGRGGRAYFMWSSLITFLAYVLAVVLAGGNAFATEVLLVPLICFTLACVFASILDAVAKGKYKKTLAAYHMFMEELSPYIGPGWINKLNELAAAAAMRKIEEGATQITINKAAAAEKTVAEKAAEKAPKEEAAPKAAAESKATKSADAASAWGAPAAPAAPAAEAKPAKAVKEAPKAESASPWGAPAAPKAEPVVSAPAQPAPRPAFKEEPKAAAPLGYDNPPKEDIVAQIDRITTEGASKATMLEVAKLLQVERAKEENKTPEQQKRLNNALAQLLKAIGNAK